MKNKSIVLTIGLTIATAGAIIAGSVLANKKSDVKTEAAVASSLATSQGSVIANDKARIWLGFDTSNPFYSYADPSTSDANSTGLNGGLKLWIHSTSSGGSEKKYNLSGNFTNNAQSRRYSYCDVDLSVYTNQWYMNVQKFQNGNWKCSTNAVQLKATNACQVYYIWGDWAWDKTQGTISPGSIDSVDAGLVAKALGGIHSCSSSNVNGYNAFPNFNSTFVKNGNNWKTVGNLGDYTVTDFADGNTSYSGSPATVTNAYTKYEFVQSQYNANSGNGTLSPLSVIGASENNSMLVIAFSTIAIASVSGYFFIRKKRISK